MKDPATIRKNRKAVARVKEAGKCKTTGYWRWQVVVGRDDRVIRTFAYPWASTALEKAEDYVKAHNANRK